MRKLICFLLPLQILVLLLSPRFGWSIHHSDFSSLYYEGTFYEAGVFHCLYRNGEKSVDIGYGNPFSKRFTITVNGTDEYKMNVRIDGESEKSEPDMLPGIANDIVWKDTYGILYWRCVLTIAMTLISMKAFRTKNRKALYAAGSILYAFSMLISLRMVW